MDAFEKLNKWLESDPRNDFHLSGNYVDGFRCYIQKPGQTTMDSPFASETPALAIAAAVRRMPGHDSAAGRVG